MAQKHRPSSSASRLPLLSDRAAGIDIGAHIVDPLSRTHFLPQIRVGSFLAQEKRLTHCAPFHHASLLQVATVQAAPRVRREEAGRVKTQRVPPRSQTRCRCHATAFGMPAS